MNPNLQLFYGFFFFFGNESSVRVACRLQRTRVHCRKTIVEYRVFYGKTHGNNDIIVTRTIVIFYIVE